MTASRTLNLQMAALWREAEEGVIGKAAGWGGLRAAEEPAGGGRAGIPTTRAPGRESTCIVVSEVDCKEISEKVLSDRFTLLHVITGVTPSELIRY